MNTNDNYGKQNQIYDKQTRTWFKVTPEQFKEYDRWRTRIRKREQYHGRCMCPRSKWWLCDGISHADIPVGAFLCSPENLISVTGLSR